LAKGLPSDVKLVVKEMEELKPSYLYDNPYFTGSGGSADKKLRSKFMLVALRHLQTGSVGVRTPEYTADGWQDRLCKNIRAVDLWQRVMLKRFGHVASESPAFQRVVEMMLTKGGLEKVAAQLKLGALHGKSDADRGIEECFLIVREMEKCKAGGHGPPQTLTSGTGATPPGSQVVGSQESQPSNVQDIDNEMAGLESALVSLTDAPVDPVAAELCKAVESEETHITFIDDSTGLNSTSIGAGAGRVTVLCEAPTSVTKTLTDLLDLVKPLCSRAFERKIPCRLLVPVHSRFKLLDTAQAKLRMVLPNWTAMVVQIVRGMTSDTQKANSKFRPFYCVALVSPLEKDAPFPHVVRTKTSLGWEQLRLRCTERDCPLRAKAPTKPAPENPQEELPADDKDDQTDVMEQMMEEAGAASDGSDNDDFEIDQDEIMAAGKGIEAAPKTEPKRNYTLDLWTYADPISYYEQIFSSMGGAGPGGIIIVCQRTCHPAAWVAARRQGQEVVVYTARLPPHSFAHGKTLFRRILLRDAMRKQGATKEIVFRSNSCMRWHTYIYIYA